MNRIRMLAAMAALLVAADAAPAQAGSSGREAGPDSAASAARSGPMGGRMMGGRWGRDYTPGWTMMTPQQRQQHQARMRDMKTRTECEAYREEHRKSMQERAREQGRGVPARPRRNACSGLPS